MHEVTLTSLASGETVVFDNGVFVLSKLETGPAKTVRTVAAAASGSGEIFSDAAIGSRRISLRGYILAEGETEEERHAFLREKRRLVCRVTDPAGTFRLTRDGLSIVCSADAIPLFDASAPLSGDDASGFTLTATASDPRFTAEGEGAASDGKSRMLSFPLSIRAAEPLVFGMADGGGTPGTFTAVNTGDITAGAVIVVEAGDAPVSGFVLENETTGERFAMASAIGAAEVIRIDTREGQKSVTSEKRGFSPADALGRIDWTSSFFRLVPGENVFSFSSDAGEARVTVVVYPAFLTL